MRSSIATAEVYSGQFATSSCYRQRASTSFGGKHRNVPRRVSRRWASNQDDEASSSTKLETDFDPSEFIVYGGRLPSRRRLLLGTSLGAVTAFGANFLGCTSALLSLDGGKLAKQYNLDVLYAVNGFRRSFDADNGYTFVFPQDWLADQTLLRRYARRVEQQNALDPPSLKKRKLQRSATEPVCAYGPPGSDGELNVSVVVAPIMDGFTLRSLGTPAVAGDFILSNFIAPPSQSDKVAELIAASELMSETSQAPYYLLEYSVESKSKGWKRHNLAVYGSNPSTGLLYTLNVQCPQEKWENQKSKLTRVAKSFQILA